MKLEITSVQGHGDYENEYVMFKVKEDCNLKDYLLFDTTYTGDNKISNKVRHPYWFPTTEVKAGELVSLWTKAGTNTVGKTTDGTPIRRFFWGLKEAVWNDEGDRALLFEISDWKAYPVKGT